MPTLILNKPHPLLSIIIIYSATTTNFNSLAIVVILVSNCICFKCFMWNELVWWYSNETLYNTTTIFLQSNKWVFTPFSMLIKLFANDRRCPFSRTPKWSLLDNLTLEYLLCLNSTFKYMCILNFVLLLICLTVVRFHIFYRCS